MVLRTVVVQPTAPRQQSATNVPMVQTASALPAKPALLEFLPAQVQEPVEVEAVEVVAAAAAAAASRIAAAQATAQQPQSATNAPMVQTASALPARLAMQACLHAAAAAAAAAVMEALQAPSQVAAEELMDRQVHHTAP